MCIPLEYLQPVGLFLDIIGFSLIFVFGHAVFIRLTLGEPKDNEGMDGHIAVPTDSPEAVSRNRRFRSWAYLGVGLVIIGFIVQLAASVDTVFL